MLRGWADVDHELEVFLGCSVALLQSTYTNRQLHAWISVDQPTLAIEQAKDARLVFRY